MDVFEEALTNLDCLRDLATRCARDPHVQVDASSREQALENVVHLRRTVIEATRRTETDRTALDTAARKEGAAAVALSSLQSRIHSIEERIKNAKKEVEVRGRRVVLEAANEELASAKERLKAKREFFEAREKKLREFQKELTPVLKLGTASYVSEFDDDMRIAAAFAALPRSLQFLYSQLRNAKKAFELPIEIGIVPVPKMMGLHEAGSGEIESSRTETMMSPVKKQRLSERKIKHTTEEKRRKRWYESIAGKETTTYEDWIAPQRVMMASGIHGRLYDPRQDTKMPKTHEKYDLLMQLSEGLKKQMTSNKHSKRRKHRHPTRPPGDECTRFPLPVPKGDLCVEVKFLDGEKEVAVFTFTVHGREAFVCSSPDRTLVRTIKQDDHAIQWEHEMKKIHPRQYKALIATYGYPFAWAQELCGARILKHQVQPSAEDIRQMNTEMMQQQEFIADFVARTKAQAIALKAFRSSIMSMEEEAMQATKREKRTELIQFRQIPPEKLTSTRPEQTGSSSYSGLAAGTWAAVMKRLPANGKMDLNETNETEMEVDGSAAESKEHIKIKFYPHSGKEIARNLGISRTDVYFEACPRQHGPLFRMVPSEKLKEAATKKNVTLEAIEGPLSSEDIGSADDTTFGQFVVRKAAKLPKKFSSVLPVDYKSRFFPFTLPSKRRRSQPEMTIPEREKELYKAYRMVLQLGHIRLYALIRVSLLRPLFPTVLVEKVTAASTFRKKETVPVSRDSKAKTAVDAKGKTDHIKTERERIMRRETEIMKHRDVLETAAACLENIDREQAQKKKPKKTPSFHCEDAKLWITRKIPSHGKLSPTEVVRKLETLMQEWCAINSKPVSSLNTYLGSGSRSKSHGRENSSKRPRSTRVSRDPPKEKTASTRADMKHSSVLDEELEQGEIPSNPKPKHTTRHRSTNRRLQPRDAFYKGGGGGRQRSRSPSRVRFLPNRMEFRDGPRNVRYPSRTPLRTGSMRMDDEAPRDRIKPSNFPPRMTRM